MKFNRHILIHLFWVLPLAFWPGNNSYDAAKFTVLAAAASLWLFNAAWLEWRGYCGLSLGTRSMAALGGLVLLVGSGVLNAANPTLVVRTCLLISLFGMVAYQTSRQQGGLSRQQPLLMAIAFAASVSGIYGLMQMAHWLPGAPASSGYPPGISTFGNQNYLAGFMAVSFWPTLVLLRQVQEKWQKLLTIFSLTIILTTLGLAGATGPQLAVLAAGVLLVPCVVMVKRGLGNRVPLVLASLFLLLGGAGLWLMVDSTSGSSDQVHHKLLAANHGDIRQTDWLAALEMTKSNPLMGVGAGNYLVQWPQTKAHLTTTGVAPELPGGTPISTRAHNDLLQWIAETGVMGGLYFLCMLGILGLAWRKFFLLQPPKKQIDDLLLTTGLLTVAVHSMVSFPFHLPATALVVAMLLGLLFLDDRTNNNPSAARMGKIQALALVMVALVLAAGSFQEFRGDLKTASGRRAFTQGKMQQAVAMLESGVQQMKWPGQGYLYLGLAQTAVGQSENSENNFRRSLNDRPSYEALLALAESAINRGDFSTAENHLNLIRSCEPVYGFIQQENFLRGFMLVRQGHLDSARQAFIKILQQDPKQHRALLGLGYLEALQDRPQQAKQFYTQAVAVIDLQIAEFRDNPGQESAAFLVRLQQNRRVASKALESMTRTP